MRRCVGVLMVVTLLLAFGPSANATRTWVSGNTGNWSDTANWSGNTLPGTTETAQVNNGNATVDASQTIGQLLMGDSAATDVGVLNINTNVTLNISKGSSELFGMLKIAGASATVNQSAGTVNVFYTGYAGTGETRLVTSSSTTGTSIYNLSGTGVLDTEVLSKGNKNNADAQFNATGGTLVIRNLIYRFGLISENGVGFNQGGATLEIGAIDTVKAINVGNATNAVDYSVGSGAAIDLDIASASSFDKVNQIGAIANLAGATMNIDLLGGFAPTPDSFFDVWTITDTAGVANGNGSGSVVLPTGWTSSWIDTNADSSLDTLRLTFAPEPATIALLGLGFLALRRNKK